MSDVFEANDFGFFICLNLILLSFLFGLHPTRNEQFLNSNDQIIFDKLGNKEIQYYVKRVEKNLEKIFRQFDSFFQIEFSFLNFRSLYESFGSLVNSFLLIDFRFVSNFVEKSFSLLNNERTVFLTSICLIRLFYKLPFEKLQNFISFSFTVNSDESLRKLSSLIDVSFFEKLSDENFSMILNGTLRGFAFSGDSLRTENKIFLSRIIENCSEKVFLPFYDQIFGILTCGGILENKKFLFSISKLAKFGEFFKDGIFCFPNLVFYYFSFDKIVSDGCQTILSEIYGLSTIEDTVDYYWKQFGDEKFNIVCHQIFDKVNLSNVNLNILNFFDRICQRMDSRIPFRAKFIDFLFSFLEDKSADIKKCASDCLSHYFVIE